MDPYNWYQSYAPITMGEQLQAYGSAPVTVGGPPHPYSHASVAMGGPPYLYNYAPTTMGGPPQVYGYGYIPITMGGAPHTYGYTPITMGEPYQPLPTHLQGYEIQSEFYTHSYKSQIQSFAENLQTRFQRVVEEAFDRTFAKYRYTTPANANPLSNLSMKVMKPSGNVEFDSSRVKSEDIRWVKPKGTIPLFLYGHLEDDEEQSGVDYSTIVGNSKSSNLATLVMKDVTNGFSFEFNESNLGIYKMRINPNVNGLTWDFSEWSCNSNSSLQLGFGMNDSNIIRTIDNQNKLIKAENGLNLDGNVQSEMINMAHEMFGYNPVKLNLKHGFKVVWELFEKMFKGDFVPWKLIFEDLLRCKKVEIAHAMVNHKYPTSTWPQFVEAFIYNFGTRGSVDLNLALSKLEQDFIVHDSTGKFSFPLDVKACSVLGLIKGRMQFDWLMMNFEICFDVYLHFSMCKCIYQLIFVYVRCGSRICLLNRSLHWLTESSSCALILDLSINIWSKIQLLNEVIDDNENRVYWLESNGYSSQIPISEAFMDIWVLIDSKEEWEMIDRVRQVCSKMIISLKSTIDKFVTCRILTFVHELIDYVPTESNKLISWDQVIRGYAKSEHGFKVAWDLLETIFKEDLAPRNFINDALLIRVETNFLLMSLMTEEKLQTTGLHRFDFEFGKIIIGGKFEKDARYITIKVIATNSKGAHVDNSGSTFWGSYNDRVCLWDMGDRIMMDQNLATAIALVLKVNQEHKYSKWTNSRCFASIDESIVIGSFDWRWKLGSFDTYVILKCTLLMNKNGKTETDFADYAGYFTLHVKQLTDPFWMLPKDETVEKVVEFMDSYSINQQEFDSIVEISMFSGHTNPMVGMLPAVKVARTKAYTKGSSSHVVRAADLIKTSKSRKAPKKHIIVMIEPVDERVDENGDNQSSEGMRQLRDVPPTYGIDVCEVYVEFLKFEHTATNGQWGQGAFCGQVVAIKILKTGYVNEVRTMKEE